VKLTGDGVSVAQLRKSLNGNARFALTHGAVKGVNITALANQAWALYHRQPPAPQTGPNQTDFSRLSGSATVIHGLIRNQDLLLESPSLRATGAGTVNLVNDQIDYLLKALLIRPGQSQAGSAASQLKGLTVPIRVTGTIEKPRYQLDLEAALTESQKARLQQKKQELEQKLQQKLQDRLKNLFK
ncbi:MAG: AsmA family protein, partial [Gammaproteobacteria bacterium]|nr:AsmA family protein [Gammaproteobacteria bacterium]